MRVAGSGYSYDGHLFPWWQALLVVGMFCAGWVIVFAVGTGLIYAFNISRFAGWFVVALLGVSAVIFYAVMYWKDPVVTAGRLQRKTSLK